MKFNDSQLKAVSHFTGPMLVLAGPGSGKTTVIIHRIINLITNCHVPPENILAVTFSRAAAAEMSERFNCAFNTGGGAPTFVTFHSIFLSILKSESSSPLNLISEQRKSAFIRSQIEKYNLPYDNPVHLVKELLTAISRLKCFGSLENEQTEPPAFQKIYSAYQDHLVRHGLIDFDDIIILCRRLFRENAPALSKWQHRFPFILVDEFQDISPAQYDAITSLAGESANLLVVGDDDQSIYGFRGASPASLKQFLKDYPTADQVLLDINYRCAPEIVEASLKVIGENEDRFEKKLIPAEHVGGFGKVSAADSVGLRGDSAPAVDSPAAFNGKVLTIDSFAERRDEYEKMIEMIRDYHASGVVDIAVLFRNNADYMLLARMLADRNIPFESAETPDNFLNSFIVQDICAYMRIAYHLASFSSVPCRDAFLRIINKPLRYIARDSLTGRRGCGAGECLSALQEYYRKNFRVSGVLKILKQDLSYMSDLAPFAQVKYIRSVMGYDKWLKNYSIEKRTDFEELESIADMFEEYCEGFKTVEELEAAIYESRKREHLRNTDVPAEPNVSSMAPISIAAVPPVRLLTMHASKGMEFDVVFIPDANDGLIPNKRNLTEGSESEERRLLYVAMTRAKKHLHISYVHMLHNKGAEISRFLRQLI